MRNVFDQYGQTENRITHAFMTSLDRDRALLGHFLRDLVGMTPPVPASKLSLLSQRYPGEPEPTEDEAERRGIPDGWIFDVDAEWCVLLESKIQAKLSLEQLPRHRRAAERLGFRTAKAVAITAGHDLPPRAPRDTVLLRWRDVYAWLIQHRRSAWGMLAAEYLEIVEARLIETERFTQGALTMFAGVPFGRERPYTYLEGKRLLLLMCEELRASQTLQARLGVDPHITGRSAITGSQSDGVWNFLAISGGKDAASFTRYPHLSLGIDVRRIDAMLTFPNAVNTRARNALRDLGEGGFREVLTQVLKNMKPLLRAHPGAVPTVHAQQRRWPSIRAVPFHDALIRFDLRTAVPGYGKAVLQPVWLAAAYGAFAQKRGANYELQVGVHFPYSRCPELAKASAVQMIEAAWLACKPMIDIVR